MIQYVCVQLDVKQNGTQTCTKFEVLQDSASFLPSIPPSDAAAISAAILMVYATIWVFNAIRQAFDF